MLNFVELINIVLEQERFCSCLKFIIIFFYQSFHDPPTVGMIFFLQQGFVIISPLHILWQQGFVAVFSLPNNHQNKQNPLRMRVNQFPCSSNRQMIQTIPGLIMLELCSLDTLFPTQDLSTPYHLTTVKRNWDYRQAERKGWWSRLLFHMDGWRGVLWFLSYVSVEVRNYVFSRSCSSDAIISRFCSFFYNTQARLFFDVCRRSLGQPVYLCFDQVGLARFVLYRLPRWGTFPEKFFRFCDCYFLTSWTYLHKSIAWGDCLNYYYWG